MPSSSTISRWPGGEGRRALPFLLPALVVLCMVSLYPLVQGVSRVFYSYRALARQDVFSGWENFTLLLSDPTFSAAFLNSIVWTATSVAGMFLFGYALATMLNSKHLRFRRFFRTASLVPWALPGVVISLIWRYIFLPNGPLNAVLGSLGLRGPEWLTNPSLALWTCVIATVWMGTPFVTVMLLAGLQSLEPELLEAAAIDGASYIQSQVHVIMPSMRKMILIVLTLETIWTFNSFDIVFVLTKGGPGSASMTLPLYAYQNAFMYYQAGYGAAIGVVILSVLLLAVVFYIREVLR